MLRHLSLQNFRNHARLTADFAPEGAIITGANGTGKTSILEAIFLLSTLRSFRHRSMEQIVQDGKTDCEIIATTDAEEFALRWQFSPQKKTVLRRNNVVISTTEMLKRKAFFAVLFSPEELQLPYASPRDRRRFMNRLFTPLFPSHLKDLRSLDKIIESRNALLKRIAEGVAVRDEIDFYDRALTEVSVRITELRQRFFEETQSAIAQFYRQISGTTAELQIKFSANVDGDLLAILRMEYLRDLARGTTSRGAHHDDFCFLLDGQPLESHGSRGEVRSAILALKMAERDYVRTITKTEPVLLLDDVFSELDADRRRHLMEFIAGRQCFVTTTDTPSRAIKSIDLPIFALPLD